MSVEPQASDSSWDAILDELAEDYALRLRAGAPPSISEYTKQYPHLADEIRSLFPALNEMEQAEPICEPALPTEQVWTNQRGEPLEQLGDYQIVREIGRGGMGVVFEVEQISLGRRVALKAVPSQFAVHAHQRERFAREARAAARLHHTNIVPVFGVGEQDGVPYYVMQFIPGRGLDAVLKEVRRIRQPEDDDHQRGSGLQGQSGFVDAGVSLEATVIGMQNGAEPRVLQSTTATQSARIHNSDSTSGFHLSSVSESTRSNSYAHSVARIGMHVADAIHYAHLRGILHRDIKPSNLLLDESGIVWVTDFGLAKVDDLPELTKPGDFLGTLRYTAPESLRGRSGPESDQFSLGLTLYEMLTLVPAFPQQTPPELIDAIKACELRPIRELSPEIPRDLETIIQKATAREIPDRYRNTGELRDDLQRFLNGEPIRARRFNPLQRLAKWSARHPAVAFLLASCAVLLTAFVSLLVVSRQNLKVERDAATNSAAVALQHAQEASRLRTQAEGVAQDLAASINDLQTERAEELFESGQTSAAVAILADIVRKYPEDTVAARRLVAAMSGNRFVVPAVAPLQHPSKPLKLRISNDGKWIASATRDQSIIIWDGLSGEQIAGPTAVHGRVAAMRFIPGSPEIVMGFDDGRVVVANFKTGGVRALMSSGSVPVESLGVNEPATRLAILLADGSISLFSVDEDFAELTQLSVGRREEPIYAEFFAADRLFVGCQRGAYVVDADHGQILFSIPTPGGVVGRAANFDIHPNGGLVVIGSSGGKVRLADLATGDTVGEHDFGTRKLSSTRLGSRSPVVVAASYDGTATIWNYGTDEVEYVFRHDDQVTYAEFSDDEEMVLSTSRDATLRIWDRATGELVAEPVRHVSTVLQAQFNPTAPIVVTRSDTAEIRLLALPQLKPSELTIGNGNEAVCVAWSPRGRFLVTGFDDGRVVLSDSEGHITQEITAAEKRPRVVQFHPDGTALLVTRDQGVVNLQHVSDTGELRKVRNWNNIYRAVFSPDGSLICLAGKKGRCLIVDAETLERRASLSSGDGELLRYAEISADNRFVATTSNRGELRMYDLNSGEVLLQDSFGTKAAALTFSPDGRLLLCAAGGNHVSVWDVATCQPLPDLKHTGTINRLAFNKDGSLLVTASNDNTACVWDTTSLSMVAAPLHHRNVVKDAVFTASGSVVVTTSTDGTTRLWDSQTGDSLKFPYYHDTSVRALAVQPNGGRIAVAVNSGAVVFLPTLVPEGDTPQWLPEFAEALGGARMAEDAFFTPVAASQSDSIVRKIRAETSPTAWHHWARRLLGDSDVDLPSD